MDRDTKKYTLNISIRTLKRGEYEDKVHTCDEEYNELDKVFEAIDYYGELVEGANDEGLLAEAQADITNNETGEKSSYFINQLGHIDLLEGVRL